MGGNKPNEHGVSARCESALDRAAGDYGRCLLRADASYARNKDTNQKEKSYARCKKHFDHRVNRSIKRNGADLCPSSELLTAMGDRTFNYAKGIASEASGKASPTYLYVQDGSGGTISADTLTLTGVSDETIFFTDRPYRRAGKVTTKDFISPWYQGDDSFGEVPPNADFTCEVDDEIVNYTVELLSPSLTEGELSYSVKAIGDIALPETTTACKGDAYLLIDCCFK